MIQVTASESETNEKEQKNSVAWCAKGGLPSSPSLYLCHPGISLLLASHIVLSLSLSFQSLTNSTPIHPKRSCSRWWPALNHLCCTKSSLALSEQSRWKRVCVVLVLVADITMGSSSWSSVCICQWELARVVGDVSRALSV